MSHLLGSLEPPAPMKPVQIGPSLGAKGPFDSIGIAAASSLFGRNADDRTMDEFRTEVAEYETSLKQAIEQLPASLAPYVLPVPSLTIVNESKRYFSELKIELTLPEGIIALGKPDGSWKLRDVLPRRPAPYGPKDAGPFAGRSPFSIRTQDYTAQMTSAIRSQYGTEIKNSGAEPISDRLRDLRADRRLKIATDIVLLIPFDYGDQLTIGWNVTAKDVDADANGTVSFALSESIDLFNVVRIAMNETHQNKKTHS